MAKYVKPSERRKKGTRSYSSSKKPSVLSYVFGIITLISLLSWAYQSTGISINGNKSPYALKVGDCINDSFKENQKNESISSVKTSKCLEPHNWEVFYVGETSGNLAKESTRDSYVSDRCDKEKAIFLAQPGISLKSNPHEMGIQYILPSAQSWLQGDRFYSCMLGDSAKLTVGNLRDKSTPKSST